MKKSLLSIVIVCGIALLAGACTPSAPLSTKSADTAAKQFEPIPGYATIYVYRKRQITGRGYLVPVTMDDRLIGHISEYDFLRIDAEAGKHFTYLKGGSNMSPAEFEVEADTVYYVEFSLEDGYAVFRRVLDEEEAKKAIRKRDLARNYFDGIMPVVTD